MRLNLPLSISRKRRFRATRLSLAIRVHRHHEIHVILFRSQSLPTFVFGPENKLARKIAVLLIFNPSSVGHCQLVPSPRNGDSEFRETHDTRRDNVTER